MSNSMRDGLTQVLNGGLQTKPAHSLPEVVSVRQLEEGSIEIIPVNCNTIGARIKSPNVLFLELRRKIRELTGDSSWTVRYASQVDAPLLPFLHSSSQLKVLVDPMSPYRNPIDALAKDGVLILVLLPSHVYYFKPKEEALRDTTRNQPRPASRTQETSVPQES